MNKYKLLEKILSNTATKEEQKQFGIWINESSANKKEYNQLKEAWEKMDEVFLTKRFNTAFAKHQVKQQVAGVLLERKQKRFLRIKQIGFAATFALLLTLSFFVFMQNTRSTASQHKYASGDYVTEIILMDSTHVWLNANSTLETAKRFGKRKRKVMLTGEAFFDVKRDESKPFEILLANTKTRVLGTSFNLYHDSISGDVQLAVASGMVEFSYNTSTSDPMKVTKNESAIYSDNDHQVAVFNENNPNSFSWKTGKLVFDDTPIEQVCRDLSKYYKTKVESKLDSRTILTGTFENQSINDVLSAIQLSLDVQISKIDETYQIKR